MSLYQFDAIKKLDTELDKFKGGQAEEIVKSAVYDALVNFCRQDDEFAQAVVQNDKTLGDCVKSTVKDAGHGNPGISDLEVYRRAVQFYFLGAEVRMTMTIDLCGNVDSDTGSGDRSAGVVLDLSDFL